MKDYDIFRERISRLRELLPLEEQLAQLAEEAAELSFAALKYRRALSCKNPTPLTEEEALELLKEEVSDVIQCIDVIGILDDETTTGEILTMQDAKYDRWIDRIEKGGPNEQA